MSEDTKRRASEPQSISRFVLPFAYALERAQGVTPAAPRYEKDDEPSDERKLYFTGETRQVLFERALWLRLKGDNSAFDFNWKVPNGMGVPLNLRRNPPRLVLFEHDERGKSDPLRVGFLVLDIAVLDEIHADNFDCLLHFNELFRYFAEPFPGHAAQRDLGVALKDYLANAENAGERLGCCTERLYRGRWEVLLNGFPLQIEKDAWLLNATSARTAQNPLAAIHPDNRAFVWTTAVMKGGARALAMRPRKSSQEAGVPLHRSYGYSLALDRPEEFPEWIHFLNVDQPSKGRNSFETKWAKKRTYLRWAEGGSWYGFCYHGGAAILPPWRDPPLAQHWGGMYFDQVLLLLYVRTAAFAFSTRLSDISAKARKKGHSSREEFAEEFSELRWQFALFTNLYRFPLLSNQEQGLEMYVLARKRMDADQLFDEVDEEIRNCDDYLAADTQTTQARASTVLNLVAGVGVVLGIGLALVQTGLPMPGVRLAKDVPEKWPTFGWGIIVALGFASLAVFFGRSLQRKADQLMGLRRRFRLRRERGR